MDGVQYIFAVNILRSISRGGEERCLPVEETAIVDPAAAAAEGISTLYLRVTEFLFLLTMFFLFFRRSYCVLQSV